MRTSALVLSLAVVLGVASSADAQCPLIAGSSANSQWTLGGLVAGPASAPTADTQFNPGPAGSSAGFLAKGTTLYVVDNISGNIVGSYSFGATIQNFPVPVPLKDAVASKANSIFIGANDGKIYRFDVKIDPATGFWSFPPAAGSVKPGFGTITMTPVWTKPVYRAVPDCHLYDQVTAAPIVQLYDYANTAFKTTVNDDLVFVVTRYGGPGGSACGQTQNTANRVIALRASTGAIAWQYNASGQQALVDYGSESCTLHYVNDDGMTADPINNTLYCTTNLEPGYFQNTLWAFNTITGARQWAANLGRVWTRPQFRNNRLYVATYNGSLRVRDALANGTEIWLQQVTPPGGVITRNPWPELRITGGFNNMVLVTGGSGDGNLHALVDYGSYGAAAWTSSLGGNVTSMPAVSPFIGKVYVGKDDGKVYQLNLHTGSQDASATVGGAGTVYDAGLDVVNNASDINELAVANGSQMRRYCLPWLNGDVGTASVGAASVPNGSGPAPSPQGRGTQCTNDSQCVNYGSACTTGVCSPSGVCHGVPVADGTLCDDGLACSCDARFGTGGGFCTSSCAFGLMKCDVCTSGVCTSDQVASCTCAQAGSRACAPGQSCCGGAGCADLSNDINNCGACGHVCTDFVSGLRNSMSCIKGACQRNISAWCPNFTSAAVLNSARGNAALLGADSLSYTSALYDYGAFSNCWAYVSTYDSHPSGRIRLNGIAEIDHTGSVKTYWQNATYPLHGVDVSFKFGGTPDNVLVGNIIDYPEVNMFSSSATHGFFFDISNNLLDDTSVDSLFNSSSTVPFVDQNFDKGAVGPAIDRLNTFQNGQTKLAEFDTYWANWSATNGNLVGFHRSCASSPCVFRQISLPCWPATSSNCARAASCANIPPDYTRTTAIASGTFPPADVAFNNMIWIAQGTWVIGYNLSAPSTSPLTFCVDLASDYQPDPGNSLEAQITAILGFSVDPKYGDLYIEAKDVNNNFELLVLRSQDFKVYNVGDLAVDLGLTPAIPFAFSAEARTSVRSSAAIIRMLSKIGTAPSFSQYPILP